MDTRQKSKWVIVASVLCVGALAGVGVYALVMGAGQQKEPTQSEAQSTAKDGN